MDSSQNGWDCGLDKSIMLIVFQPEHIVKTATRLGRERRRRWSISSHASWDDAEEKDKP